MAFEPNWDEINGIIQEMNENHFGVSVGASWVYGWKKPIGGSNNYELVLQKESALQSMYKHKKVQTGLNSRNEPIKKSWANLWLEHSDRQNYNNLVFKPTSKVYPGEFNIWQGFDVDEDKYKRVKSDQCQEFANFIWDVISNQDPDIYTYLLDWLADMIQHPEKKQGVALVLKSPEEGTGKSFFCERIGSLLGPHYMLAAKSDQILGRFSGHLENNILLGAEEAVYAGDKRARNELKDMISSDKRNIERKSIDIDPNKPNFSHLIFMSNEDHVVSASTTDRRFQMIEVPTKRIRDRQYFGMLKKAWDDGEKESFLKLLQERDVSKVDLINSRIMTDEMKKQIELSLPHHEKWIKEILDDQFFQYYIQDGSQKLTKIYEFNPIENVICSDDLYSNYIDSCKKNNIKYTKVKAELILSLKKIFKTIKTVRQNNKGTKRTMWVLPGINELVSQWNKVRVTDIETDRVDRPDSVDNFDSVQQNEQYH
jgi:hypothetical protein